MKKICFVTGTRADYGILAPVMKEVAKNPDAELQIIATNMHLSPDYGMTVNEIMADGFKIDKKIESLVPGGTAKATVESMAKVLEGLADAFEELQPDLVVILGDRYEALATASAAATFNIPIAHLHGGETTEGAIDDAFRHAITKLSTLHFAATPQYAHNIVSMGENPDKVFHSGAPGASEFVEDLYTLGEEFYQKTGILPGEQFILMAMHPVTKLPDKGEAEVKATLKALEKYISQGYKVLITMPNSDPGTVRISECLYKWSESHPENTKAVKSLGSKLFRYALENASVIIGNSSAALIEAPSFRLPAINVGIRQQGRAHGISVIDVPGESDAIEKSLGAALSMEMKSVMMGLSVGVLNPYYKEDAAIFIAERLME